MPPTAGGAEKDEKGPLQLIEIHKSAINYNEFAINKELFAINMPRINGICHYYAPY